MPLFYGHGVYIEVTKHHYTRQSGRVFCSCTLGREARRLHHKGITEFARQKSSGALEVVVLRLSKQPLKHVPECLTRSMVAAHAMHAAAGRG
jgi:hypothetical protein